MIIVNYQYSCYVPLIPPDRVGFYWRRKCLRTLSYISTDYASSNGDYDEGGMCDMHSWLDEVCLCVSIFYGLLAKRREVVCFKWMQTKRRQSFATLRITVNCRVRRTLKFSQCLQNSVMVEIYRTQNFIAVKLHTADCGLWFFLFRRWHCLSAFAHPTAKQPPLIMFKK